MLVFNQLKSILFFSSSDSFQLILDFLNLFVSSYRDKAADTDMLKLSVKPTIGIFTPDFITQFWVYL